MDLLAGNARFGALPSFIADPLLAEGKLRPILPHHKLAERGVHIVYPTNRLLLPKGKGLCRFLRRRTAASRALRRQGRRPTRAHRVAQNNTVTVVTPGI
ncbi:hypothetical protein [Ensifer sp. 2YAB10]|uniref:hypothetical protein n=1 Tax=Ensifer sp. 2YAB10 TaxID=3233021 RepID=UPI003F8FC4C2